MTISVSLSEQCCKCGNAAMRLLGTSAYCNECAERLLAPLRAKWGVVQQVGEWITCNQCEARWQGRMQDGCPWCIDRYLLMRQKRKADLLHPSWLNYEPIAPQNLTAWAVQLASAVTEQIITNADATKALTPYVKSTRGLQR